MRILLKNHFENAHQALKANRFRTFFTIIGITIGIAGMTLVLSLMTSAGHLLNQQFPIAKTNVALIRSGIRPLDDITAQAQQIGAINSLSEEDAVAIASIDGVTSAPLSVMHNTIQAGQARLAADRATIVGTTPAIRDLLKLELLEGQFINEANGVVMGHQLAIDLFGTEHALGNILRVRGETLTVIGILRPIDQPINYTGINFNQSAILPISTSKRLTQQTAQIQQIALHTTDKERLQPALQEAKERLEKRHHGDSDFHILTGEEISAASSKTLATVSTIMAVVSVVSLLVGGISVMNIMLVNVAERQREVGIRKAIGATNRHIVHQFLIESAIIGLMGGLLGYIIGIAGAFLTSLFLPLAPTLQWEPAALSIGVAILTGIIFGLYPAVRAARRHTIESMRN